MERLLYIIACGLVILWLVGYLGLQIGGNLIHILLGLAIIAFLLRLIQGRE